MFGCTRRSSPDHRKRKRRLVRERGTRWFNVSMSTTPRAPKPHEKRPGRRVTSGRVRNRPSHVYRRYPPSPTPKHTPSRHELRPNRSVGRPNLKSSTTFVTDSEWSGSSAVCRRTRTWGSIRRLTLGPTGYQKGIGSRGPQPVPTSRLEPPVKLPTPQDSGLTQTTVDTKSSAEARDSWVSLRFRH